MQIKELVEKLNPVKVNYCGKENIEVKNIAQDSRNPKGTVFLHIKGKVTTLIKMQKIYIKAVWQNSLSAKKI